MEAYTVTGPAKNLLRFCRMARERAAQDCDISLITFIRPDNKNVPVSNRFIDEARATGVRVDIVTEGSRYDLRVIRQLRSLFRQNAPDVIQTHSLKSHFLARLTRPSGSRWIAFHHGYTATDLKMHAYNQLDRWSLPGADRVVTVCRPFADALARLGVKRSRIRVLSNAIEWNGNHPVESTSSLRRRWNLSDDSRILLAIGRLSNEKGHAHLLEAAHLLRQSRPEIDFQVLIVGDGPERAQLEEQTDRLRLRECVRFTGHQSDTLPFYALADIFVLPSLSEGSPNVLLEAMMTKTPAIACAVGGVPEMVEDERSALLTSAAAPAALAQAIARMIDSPELAQSLAASAYADMQENHSPEAYYAKLLTIYRELLSA
jgi:glycosyltransferase involved in cell wall biosynthesis